MNLAPALDIAYASALPPGNAGGPAALFNMALPFIAMAAIAYFMMLRPQQRQKAERERMLGGLKRGERAAEDFKNGLERKGVGVKKVAREGLGQVGVELANPANWNDALTVAAEFSAFEVTNRDEKAGRFTLAMRERQIAQLRDDAVRQGVETIRNRVDQFGVAEPTITRQGSDRILIQLPGVQDPTRAKALIGKTALLEFKLLDEQTSVEQALAGRVPETSEILYQRIVDKESKGERKQPYVVLKRTLLTGAELTRAEVQADPNSPGNWQVAIEFTANGARIFGEITEQNTGRHLAIVLDGVLQSAPRINERIPGGRAGITGP